MFKRAVATQETPVTESAIKQALDRTRVFAERQRLLKELWHVQRASVAKVKDGILPKDVGTTRA